MKKMFIKKNSIAYYFIKIIEVLLLFIGILTACCEYYGTNERYINILIKLIMIISIFAMVKIDKIKIK